MRFKNEKVTRKNSKNIFFFDDFILGMSLSITSTLQSNGKDSNGPKIFKHFYYLKQLKMSQNVKKN